MNFNSRFGEDLENMIRLKVSLGGAESTYLDRARNFDRFCSEKYPNADCLTEPLALSWIKDAGTVTGVILPDWLSREASPHIWPLWENPHMFYRIALRLDDRSLSRTFSQTVSFPRFSGKLIRTSTPQKSYVVVMSDDMRFMARTYAALRDIAFSDSEYFFPSPDGGPYTARWMQGKFKWFFARANRDIPMEFLPPVRVYDLRHRFATAVLNRWLDEKQDIHSRLPYLRTYMGHTDIEATAYYIHLLPENLVKSAGID